MNFELEQKIWEHFKAITTSQYKRKNAQYEFFRGRMNQPQKQEIYAEFQKKYGTLQRLKEEIKERLVKQKRLIAEQEKLVIARKYLMPQNLASKQSFLQSLKDEVAHDAEIQLIEQIRYEKQIDALEAENKHLLQQKIDFEIEQKLEYKEKKAQIKKEKKKLTSLLFDIEKNMSGEKKPENGAPENAPENAPEKGSQEA